MASKAMLAVLLAAAFLSSVAEGKRATVHAVEESRAGAVFDSFCFSEGGTLSIRVSNVKLGAAGEGEKQKRIGLIAQSNNEGAAISMDEFALGQCIADSPWVKEGKFLDIPITSEGSTTEKVINANEVGRVLLIYYNCETDVTPSFTLELEMKSESGSFLPAGETPLPWIYLSFAIVYLAAGIAWIVYTKKNAYVSDSSSPIPLIAFKFERVCKWCVSIALLVVYIRVRMCICMCMCMRSVFDECIQNEQKADRQSRKSTG
mmetsp:Transcript_38088/g.98353  ORF Transcript_38088/g.98353 Transcript_38088/m.98353 type:complete len:261 (-) Transcript_38088:986-1768(-)